MDKTIHLFIHFTSIQTDKRRFPEIVQEAISETPEISRGTKQEMNGYGKHNRKAIDSFHWFK
ncbi:hypothetical protein C7B76_11150 [filamentous cyanobacterium CCP2]|nr:hypothetical protein C7B76_11150 [filamentous cyanobacterium CCP2]